MAPTDLLGAGLSQSRIFPFEKMQYLPSAIKWSIAERGMPITDIFSVFSLSSEKTILKSLTMIADVSVLNILKLY